MKLKSSLNTGYSKILMLFLVMFLLIFSVTQYNKKVLYKNHIPSGLTNDFQMLVTSISDNNITFEEILNTGKISKSQSMSLMTSYEFIGNTLQEYADLAVEFKMQEEGFQYNQTTLNMQKLTLLFNEWDEIKIHSEKKQIISKVQELNSKWNSVVRSTGKSDSYTLESSSWVELIENVENSTHSYLLENKIDNIEEIRLERTEIK